MPATATPTKLRDGSWGAKVAGKVAKGDVVTIQARSGKTWQATVSRVVWTGDGVSIVATESDRPQSRGGRRGRACITDGNCSSFGSGRSCGGYDCDGY